MSGFQDGRGLGGALVVPSCWGSMGNHFAIGDGGPSGRLPSPARLLAVDDSEIYLDLISQELESEGHTITCVHSGEEALAVLARGDVFDCVLLFDRLMPGIGGHRDLPAHQRRRRIGETSRSS